MQKVFSLVSTVFLAALLSSPPALASCPSWHPLANNTTASASDVMDNFGVVLGCPDFTGNVGIGTGSPSYPLTVNGAIYNNHFGYFSMGYYTAGGPTLIVGDGQYGLSSFGSALYLWTATSGAFYFDVAGTIEATVASNGAYTQNSDIRLKKDIQTVDGLDMVMKLRGVRFVWKKTNTPDIGVIAQDVAKVGSGVRVDLTSHSTVPGRVPFTQVPLAALVNRVYPDAARDPK